MNPPSTKPDVSDKNHGIKDLESFVTVEGTVCFMLKEPSVRRESGPATRWLAALKSALGDVTGNDLLAPRTRRSRRGQNDIRPTPALFGDEAS